MPRGLPEVTVWLLWGWRRWPFAHRLPSSVWWKPGSPLGCLVDSGCRWIQGAPGRAGSSMATDCVLHLPVLPLPARDHATAAARGAGWRREVRLCLPVAHPRPDPEGWLLWCGWARGPTHTEPSAELCLWVLLFKTCWKMKIFKQAQNLSD